jgi:hypothetical protein
MVGNQTFPYKNREELLVIQEFLRSSYTRRLKGSNLTFELSID